MTILVRYMYFYTLDIYKGLTVLCILCSCKADHYGLSEDNPLGCSSCDCHAAGVKDGRTDCDLTIGQCFCKTLVTGIYSTFLVLSMFGLLFFSPSFPGRIVVFSTSFLWNIKTAFDCNLISKIHIVFETGLI